MTRDTLRWRVRGAATLLLLASLALQAVLPRSAWAACGPLDMGACVDNAEYSLYYLVASIAWNVNRWLLLLAYQLDQLRGWLVDVAFSGLYQWLTSFVAPVYVPVATAVLMLGAILFMLVPLTGQTNVVNIRHVVTWAVLTPLVLIMGGQLIGQAEQVRSDVSAQLFAQVSQATPGAIFGSAGSDMLQPAPIYPANPCGSTLVRRTITGIAMDALAAALMYADAGDIHCPDARGPSRDIPDGFYNGPPAYAYDGYVGDLDSAVERRGWVEGMQRGMNRLLQGVIPSFLAVLESMIHLVFSLSMAMLWLSLPIGLIFVFFQQTASPVSSVLRRAASVLIASWMASLMMGVLSAALVAAAELGNAGAYTGMAVGGLFLMGYLCVVALTTLWKSIGTVEQTALSLAGVSLTQPAQAAAQLATTAAAGVASGGAAYAGLAAMGGAAFAQARNAPLGERVTYAASAVAGRLPGAGAVGEVAAAMGWLATDSATYEGLYAGERSRRSWRSSRLQMERDAARWSSGAAAPPPSGPPAAGGPGRPSTQGPTGHQGGHRAPGPASMPGPAGMSGVAGFTAAGGPGGASGARAAAGVLGHAGPRGSVGVPGHTGARGAPRAVGAAGIVGAPGASGAVGAPGIAGVPGSAGAPGAMSTSGHVGAPSAAGISGAAGAAGSAGVPGPAAVAGPPGDPGPGGAPSLLQTGALPAAPDASPRSTPAASAPLPAEHPHRTRAASRIPPLPNTLANGEDWQYAGSTALADGYRHTFRHPRHPLTGRPELRTITTSTAEVDLPQAPVEEEGTL